jgi:hypothetical protein
MVNTFSNSIFEFDSTFHVLFENIDEYENPASSYMVTIRDLGEKHNVDYILYNRIKHDKNRFTLDGQLFNTRSGGLIHRRKVDLINYLNGQINELNMWIGNVAGILDNEWQLNRESIMFSDPEDIELKKTPLGAAMRSLVAPGWGQSYSGKKISSKVWAGTESTLSLAILFSYLKYDEAAKSFLKNLNLYGSSDDVQKVTGFRTQAEIDWEKHKKYSELAIAFAGATGTGWVANSIHAWIIGPRPYKNIYQKWESQKPNTAG